MTLAVLLAAAAHGAEIPWICSTEGEPWKQMSPPVLFEMNEPPTLLVKPGRSCQTIDGFGGSFNELPCHSDCVKLTLFFAKFRL